MIAQVRHSASVALSLGYATKLLATTALTAPFLTLPVFAQNLPTGASVVAGQVSIAQPSVTQMTITQSSSSAVVNYNTFSVGAGHAVNIQQPSVNAALLNRVTGDTPSTIAGSLTANGQVYLVNPNGIAITPSGTVNVGGGFVASTLGISDSDFMSGKRTFTGNGASAAISNAGTIRVGRGGYAALIGGTVDNSGSIEVPLGKVGLGSGERATLDFSGDGFLQVAAPTKSGGNDALIKHSGRIKADGGSVVISAATAREAARNAINLSGHVQARSISGRSGSITIGGGAGGRVRISGKLNVASRKHKGGHVTVTGRDIALSGATINASGKTGGGSVRIGGDWQGKGELQRAATTTVDATTTIKADATGSGNGGDVVVWSDGATTVKGQITAKGGATGDGGTIETSGHTIDFTDARIDASAQNGMAGTWLIDPVDLLIGKAAAETAEIVLNGGTNATFSTRDSSAGGPNGYVVSSGPGDITVAAPITWSTSATLTFDAYHSIAINAPLTISGAGGLVLLTNQGGGSGGTLSFAGGVQYTGTPNSGQSLTINGQPYTLLYSMSDVQTINNGLTGNYALAKSLDATGVTGFTPLGTNGSGIVLNSGNGFTGSFTGLGNTISNLTIDIGNSPYAGLFGYSSGNISDIGLIGGSVAGGGIVGGLIGRQASGSLTQAYTTGSVFGGFSVGGLVGDQGGGVIARSYATGAVVASANYVGGLVGSQSSALIEDSYASGSVRGNDATSYMVGGLVGLQSTSGTVKTSYATGVVTGANFVGGLIGSANGTVTDSYFDSETTGQSGAGGLTTVQLQAALQAGFDSAVWGILPGISYPYLKWRFPNGPSIVSGAAVDIAGGNGGLGVGLGVNGTVVAYGHTGANGYYNFMVDPAVAGSTALTWLTGERFAGGSTASRANAVGEMPGLALQGVSRGVADGLDLYADTVNIKTALPTFTDIAAMMDRGLYGDGTRAPLFAQVPDPDVLLYDTSICGCGASLSVAFHPGVPGSQAQASVRLQASAPLLTWDGSFDPNLPPLNATILAAGNVVVASNNGIGADDLNGGGGKVTMVVDGNLTLEPNSGIGGGGSVAMTVKGDLTVGADATLFALAGGIDADVDGNISLGGAPNNLVQMFGETIRVRAGGDFTMAPDTHLAAYGTGDAIRIAVGGKFDNQAVPDPSDPLLNALVVDPAQARWLVYLDNPMAGHNFGGLDSQNTAIWNTAAFAPVADSGNRYVFAHQPMLTFTSDDASKTYGATGVLTYTVSGLMSGVTGAYLGDTAAAAYSGAPLLSSAGVAPTAGVAGSPYTVAIADNGLTSAIGYGFQFVSSGKLTVTPAALTITASDASKEYGAMAILTGFTVSGLQNQETVDSLTLSSLGILPTANVASSPYAITPSHASGTFNAANYAITYVDGHLTVTPAALTITANNVSKSYGQTVTFIGTEFTTSGLQNGESVGSVTLTSLGAVASAGVAGSPYAIAASSASGGSFDAANYTITYVDGHLTVTPAALTITANSVSKSYGQTITFTGTEFTTSGLQNGENIGSVTLTSLGAAASAGVAGSPYAIAASSASGGSFDAANYTISYVDGHLMVNPAALTITANNVSKSYGQTVTFTGTEFTTSGLQNGESVGSVTLTSLGAAASAAVAGSPYAITASSASGGSFDATNYTISYVDGHLTVTPAALTITADAQSRVEGVANPPLTYRVDGTLFNNDEIHGSLATEATTASSPGAYPITQGTLGVSANYALTYRGALLTILPETSPTPVIDVGAWASRIFFDGFKPIALPDNARPVFGAPNVITSLGIGELYADPRFEQAYVCFGGGNGIAQVCFAARS